MAQHQVGDIEAQGIAAKNKETSGSVAFTGSAYATPANYTAISTLDTRLAAISGTIYPQSVIDKMTANDKVFAVRSNDDANTV